MAEIVGKHQVDLTIHIDVRPKVFLVVSAKTSADSVMVVQNRCDCVETESIETVLLHEISKVRKKKADDFVLAVVEDH
jgi:hypothetical protein